MNVLPPLPEEDIEAVFDARLIHAIRGCRVLFTGASGFFGSWLLESLLSADRRWNLGVTVLVVTRNGARFAGRLPHLVRDGRVEMIEGNVENLKMPPGDVDWVIHSLVPDAGIAPENTRIFFHSATKTLLEIARKKKSRGFVLCSTGAVYQPSNSGIPFREGDPVFDSGTGYGAIRREMELQCLGSDVPVKVARCFSFVGPRLPLEAGFAVGNFLNDVLHCRPVRIAGDGLPVRSYLYASDLARWLWTILLLSGPQSIYNVGSGDPVTIREAAEKAAGLASPAHPPIVEKKVVSGVAPSWYVPNTALVRKGLGLEQTISFEHALRRTYNYYAMSKDRAFSNP